MLVLVPRPLAADALAVIALTQQDAEEAIEADTTSPTTCPSATNPDGKCRRFVTLAVSNQGRALHTCPFQLNL